MPKNALFEKIKSWKIAVGLRQLGLWPPYHTLLL